MSQISDISLDGDSGHAQALVRGLAVLSAFSSQQPSLGVSEIGRSIGLSRSTTHRYVATLTALKYLRQDPATRKYRLGPRVLNLGFSAINSMELIEVAKPHLRQLTHETGFTSSMAILDGVDVIYVARCKGSAQERPYIDINVHVGSRLPAYCTSMGKVLLAYLSPTEQVDALKEIKFVRLGPKTVTSRTALAAELRRVRSAGLAISDDEVGAGKRALAAPVLSADGAPVAAISIALHTSVGPIRQLVTRLGPTVREAADRISSELGYGAI